MQKIRKEKWPEYKLLCPCCANNAAEIRDISYGNETALTMHMEDRHSVFELARCLSKIVETVNTTLGRLIKDRDIWNNEMQEEADCGYYTSAGLAQMEIESIDRTVEILKTVNNKCNTSY